MIRLRLLAEHRPDLLADFPLNPAGCEAILAAAILDLRAEDQIMPRRLVAIARMVRGLPVADSDPVAERVAVDYTLRNSNEMSIAAGLALGLRIAQKAGAVIAVGKYKEEQELGQIARFAMAYKLPILYVLESAKGIDDIKSRTASLSLPVIIVDGSDAVAILRVIQECTRRATQGHGPSLVECPRGDQDPLTSMRVYMQTRDLWSEDWHQTIAADFRSKLHQLPPLQS
jgi:TPP-dependent pyruvate/acetoin dehydrogenase alpha subunit